MSARAKAFMNLYKRGRITADAVREAYRDGLITEAEMNEILGVDA